MTAAVSSKGQIVIPKSVRERMRLTAGDQLEVVVTPREEILLRRLTTRPKRSLAWYLAKFHGLELRPSKQPAFSRV